MSDVMRQEYKVLNDDEKAHLKAVKDAGQAFYDALGHGASRELSLAKTKIEEAVMWAVKHITAPVVLFALLIAGCAPSSEMVAHGTKKFLFTQTQNQWGENVVLVSECAKDLKYGACDPEGEIKMLVVGGKLPGVVSGVASDAAVIGSAFVIRDGLIKGKSTTNVRQKNQTDIRASTVNPK